MRSQISRTRVKKIIGILSEPVEGSLLEEEVNDVERLSDVGRGDFSGLSALLFPKMTIVIRLKYSK